MIVMLSVQRNALSRGAPGPPAGRPDPPSRASPARVRTVRDTPGRPGLAGLTMAFSLWTRVPPSVDGVTCQSFFLTHPVDGISAGSAGAVGRSFCLVLNRIPSRRTARAACLHRLSTDLCTARLDEVRRSQKTVTTVL